jgi:tryptophanyl-tRNA synthetase
MKKIITGVKSTGSSMHLGNLMWAILPFVKAAKGNDAAIFVADLHTINSVKNGKTLREQTREIAIEYFSIFGLDTPINIFIESDIVNLPKMSLILSNATPYSLMLRAHAFKDAEAKWTDVNMWTFNYPILMAADIIGYDIDAVPVGRDQIQHLEMTRDMVRAFNRTYGVEVFREPEAIIAEEVATLPGIDGRKMSKSYDNFIGVFDDDKTLKKRVMSIVSGSEGIDEKKKNPDECNIFNLYRVFATPEQTAALRVKYESEGIGYGYGHAKAELLTVLTEYLRPYREARTQLLEHPEIVEARLAEWARVMNARLDAMMVRVCDVVGVN